MSRRIAVAIEAAPKKAFATAVDWPGWSRSGKTPELALEGLAAYATRYAAVAAEAGEPFPPAASPGTASTTPGRWRTVRDRRKPRGR